MKVHGVVVEFTSTDILLLVLEGDSGDIWLDSVDTLMLGVKTDLLTAHLLRKKVFATSAFVLQQLSIVVLPAYD